jgi:hypothetical protein
MVLSEEFKNIAQQGIDKFLEHYRANADKLLYIKKGISSDHPQDYNFGHSMGYLEGILSSRFKNMHKRDMLPDENFELREMLAKIMPEIKQLIFDAEHR